MSQLPIPGALYIHKKSGKEYIVEGCLPIKIDGKWLDQGVTVYNSLTSSGGVWCRLTPDFIESFEFVREDL